MGAAQSNLAEKHASRGWPSFMNDTQMQAQLSKYRMQRSLLGRRVRFTDRVDGCIEYARLMKREGSSHTYFQRMDSACGGTGSPPKFPQALTANEVRGNQSIGPYRVSVYRPNYIEISDVRPGVVSALTGGGLSGVKCATYRRTERGTWNKIGEQCRETRHQLKINEQQRRGKKVL